MILISVLFSLIFSVSADDQFLPLRSDYNVPAQCEDILATQFSKETQVFTYGRKGAKSNGFSFEYPIERGHAAQLWEFFREFAKGKPSLSKFKKIRSNRLLYRDYKIIMATYRGMDVDFGNEGDILEVLATHDMRNRFPAPAYFITGGIEYRKSAGSRTIGEIDVLVGSSSDCQVLFVGEVKLGTGSALRKARQQLQRFSDFIGEETGSTLGRVVDPASLLKCTDVIAI